MQPSRYAAAPPDPAPHAAVHDTVSPELEAARTRAAERLRRARAALELDDPAHVFAALREAWYEIDNVPGGDAFQDLVAIDAVAQQLRRHDRDSAGSALDAVADRFCGHAPAH